MSAPIMSRHPLEQLAQQIIDVEMAERRVGHGLDGSQSILDGRLRGA